MEKVMEFFQSHVFLTNTVFQICCLVFAFMFLFGWWFHPVRALNKLRSGRDRETEDGLKRLSKFRKEIDELINQAIKRAPPIEDPNGVPFEVYRKDLYRMVEGEISLDEFVDIWRGRKVQKRPKPAEIQEIKTQANERIEGLGSVEELISKELMTAVGWAFLAEWQAHLKNNKPEDFGKLFIHHLNQGTDETKNFYAKFADFMKPRDWGQVLPVIEVVFGPSFDRPSYGQSFYNTFRKEVLDAICKYWEGLQGKIIAGVKDPPSPDDQVRHGDLMRGVAGGVTGHVGYPGAPGGATGLQGGGSVDKKSLMDEIREARDNDPSTFDMIVKIINGFYPGISAAAAVKNCREYKYGKWVRVIRPSSAACGLIGFVLDVKGSITKIEVHNAKARSLTFSLFSEDFEPALPRVGEWWCLVTCQRHSVIGGGQILIGPDCEWWLSEKRIENWDCGCMEPVNYGKGEK